MITIANIKNNIQHWNEIKNNTTGYNLLNSGLGITISRKELEHWEAIRVIPT